MPATHSFQSQFCDASDDINRCSICFDISYCIEWTSTFKWNLHHWIPWLIGNCINAAQRIHCVRQKEHATVLVHAWSTWQYFRVSQISWHFYFCQFQWCANALSFLFVKQNNMFVFEWQAMCHSLILFAAFLVHMMKNCWTPLGITEATANNRRNTFSAPHQSFLHNKHCMLVQ